MPEMEIESLTTWLGTRLGAFGKDAPDHIDSVT
jgi:hypothetical protein